MYKITRNYLQVIICLILFSTSAWLVNYYFMFSYTNYLGFLYLLSLYLLVSAYFIFVNSGKINYYLFATSGFILGLCFSVALSSAVVIVLQPFLLLYLFYQKDKISILKIFACYFGFLALALLPLAVNYDYIALHLRENSNSWHYEYAEKLLGYIPRVPFFSFLHISYFYSPVLTIYFVISSIYFIFRILFRKVTLLANDKLIFALIHFIWFCTIIIDILPNTKLARAHFIVFPLLVITTTYVAFYIVKNTGWPQFLLQKQKYIYAVLFFIVGIIVFFNFSLSSDILHTKTFTPKYLTTLIGQKVNLYLVEEDPHNYFLGLWLKEFPLKTIKYKDINKVLDDVSSKKAVIIGPTGEESGLSILLSAIAPTFFINFPQNKRIVILPYYSTFPSFLLEEEICEALFLENKFPDYRQPDSNIKLLLNY